jgi:ABC-type uncharacterized transport system fused permease/ATPase subunit
MKQAAKYSSLLKDPSSLGGSKSSSLNPVWDFFSSIIWLVTTPIILPLKITLFIIQPILNALAKFSIIKNCLYILNGHSDEDNIIHPSVKGAKKDSKSIYWDLAKIIASGLVFSALMYTNIFIYKNFLDAFGSGNSFLFQQTLIQYAILTLSLVTIRAISKYIRKTTQSVMTQKIRAQWVNLISSVNLEAFSKRQAWLETPQIEKDKRSLDEDEDEEEEPKSNDLGQIIQDEVDDTASYAVVTMTQLLYMTCDAIFFSYFLLGLAPNLMILALATTAICTVILYYPGNKQLKLQKRHRNLESKYRKELKIFEKNKAIYKQSRILDQEQEKIQKLTDKVNTVYQQKVWWETIYSGINRLISYLSIPAALVLIAPGFSSGAVTFGVVMASLRCFKDFLNSVTLINDNRKMFNKFDTGVKRLQFTAKELYAQKKLEDEARARYEIDASEGKIIIPGSELSIKKGTANHEETYTLMTDELILEPGVHQIKGPSGSGKSLLFKVIEGTFLQNESATMTSPSFETELKITIPYELDDTKVYHHTQNSRGLELVNDTDFTAEELIYKSWPQLKGRIDKKPEDPFTISSLKTPFKNLSGGQKDSVSLIGLFALLDYYKTKPSKLPIKTLILDEVDQGFGCKEEDEGSQVVRAFSALFEKLKPYNDTLITLIASHKLEQIRQQQSLKSHELSPPGADIKSDITLTPREDNLCSIQQTISAG